MDITFAGAFVGGVLTLLSPCAVMLLPAFFAYAFTSSGALLARTGVFYLGLLTTLVPLGVLAGTVGAFVSTHRATFVTVASVLVIVLGVIQLLGLPLPMLSRSSAAEGTSVTSVYLLGLVYGLAGVCAGPVLGAVLTLAALGGNALHGGLVLVVFAAGMTVPLLVLAALWSRIPTSWLRPRRLVIGRWSNAWTNVIGGALMIGVGVLLIASGGTAAIAAVLGADEQTGLESSVLLATRGVPDLVVAIVAVIVLVGVWVTFRFVRRKREQAA